jgi:hypothetical protein
MNSVEVHGVIGLKLPWREIRRVCGHAALGAAAFALLATTASATVIGTVNISAGQAKVTATGTSVIFSPPCDAGATGSAIIGGCASGEVGTYNPGTPGTPADPLQSSVNGSPPVNSAVFIAPLSTSTSFPLIPFMQFLNSAGTAVGITIEADANSFGNPFGSPPGAQTNCTGLPQLGNCSIYQGALIILENDGNAGTGASIPFQGFAWDGASTTRPADASVFFGQFKTQLTFVSGINGSGPNGVVTPEDIQKFFGCPTGSTSTTAGQCTALGNTITSTNGSTFTAVITAVPEPESLALSFIGAGLLGLGIWKRKAHAK